MASTTGWRNTKPESWPPRMLTRVTLGATPDVPSPLSPAATSPATWVPCPLSSTSLGSTQDGTSHGTAISGVAVGEVAAERAVEVGPQIRVVAVDAGVDDAHQHPRPPLVDPVGAARGGVDHPHVPLLVGQRLLVGHPPGLRGPGLGRGRPGPGPLRRRAP